MGAKNETLVKTTGQNTVKKQLDRQRRKNEDNLEENWTQVIKIMSEYSGIKS